MDHGWLGYIKLRRMDHGLVGYIKLRKDESWFGRIFQVKGEWIRFELDILSWWRMDEGWVGFIKLMKDGFDLEDGY